MTRSFLQDSRGRARRRPEAWWPQSLALLVGLESLFVLYQVQTWKALVGEHGLPMFDDGLRAAVLITTWVLRLNLLAVSGLWLSTRFSAPRTPRKVLGSLAVAILFLLLSNNMLRLARTLRPDPVLAVIERTDDGYYPATWVDWDAIELRWPGLRREMTRMR